MNLEAAMRIIAFRFLLCVDSSRLLGFYQASMGPHGELLNGAVVLISGVRILDR